MTDIKIDDKVWLVVIDRISSFLDLLEVKEGFITKIKSNKYDVSISLDCSCAYCGLDKNHEVKDNSEKYVFKTEKEAWEMVNKVVYENLIKQLSLMPKDICFIKVKYKK